MMYQDSWMVRLLSVLVLLALAALALALPAHARDVYASNAIGTRVRRLPADTALSYSGYLLVVDGTTANRSERLYDHGTLVRRVQYTTAGRTQTESVYQPDTLAERNVYNANRQLISATTYDAAGAAASIVRYRYERNRVVVEHLDGAEMLLFNEERQIDQSGRITMITRTYVDGRQERVDFVFLERRLLRELHRIDDLAITLDYDSAGRLIREEQRMADQPATTIVYTYDADVNDRIANTVSRTEWVDGSTRREQIRNDEAGRAVTQVTYQDDVLVEEAMFEYNQERLLSMRIRRTGSTSQQQFIYSPAGAIVEERWYDNGVLVRTVTAGDQPGSTIELRYLNERPYVRIYFERGVRIREEFLSGDAVTRERLLE